MSGPAQHVQRQPAHRRCGVERLGHRDEGDRGGIEDGDDAGEVGERAGQPVDLVDDHHIDAARPLHRRAGKIEARPEPSGGNKHHVALASNKSRRRARPQGPRSPSPQRGCLAPLTQARRKGARDTAALGPFTQPCVWPLPTWPAVRQTCPRGKGVCAMMRQLVGLWWNVPAFAAANVFWWSWALHITKIGRAGRSDAPPTGQEPAGAWVGLDFAD